MMMRSGFSMNRDITPSSPHPLSKGRRHRDGRDKESSDHAIGNPQAEGEVERETSTLSCVPINCEPALTVVGDATGSALGSWSDLLRRDALPGDLPVFLAWVGRATTAEQ
jgi:hypothetical protein